MKPLRINPQVEKAIRRLKNMGLTVEVLSSGDKEVYIFITLRSLANLIDKHIKYKNKKITIEGDYLVIYLWKR